MVRLVYSNRTDQLLAELAARVRAQQVRDGPLVPVRIVVPSATVEAYVRLGIATECGIAANLDVSLLARFGAEIVAATAARVADAATIEALTLGVLLDDSLLERPHLAPVRAYLHACGDTVDPIDVRRVQLAGRVGRLFEEYSHSRGDMLAAWRRGAAGTEQESDVERWQRGLWLAILDAGALAAKRLGAPRVIPLNEAVAAVDPTSLSLPPSVHVFAFSHIARTFQQLFERIAQRIDVVIYAVSPCEGFWEDVDERDPAPLQQWGRPGREQVRALNAIAGFDHEDRFVDPLDPAGDASRRTLLRQLQSDVLRRTPTPSSPPSGSLFNADDSIAVIAHASIRRELEAVASSIWRLVEADETLHFDDIAVVLPDADQSLYAAHLPTVFREAHQLPHQTAGLTGPLAASSRVAEAMTLLFALPLSRFTRQDLLRVALHPAASGLSAGGPPARWLAWCDALGVVHGADRDDHEGTYIERDSLNWDQGLRRLALGSFMAGDASGEPRPFLLAGQSYVPHEVPPGELHDAAAFGRKIRSLIGDAQFARDAELTMTEWSSFFRALAETYVTPTNRGEEEEFARLLRGIHAVGDVDLGERRVRFRIASEIALSRLGGVARGPRGEGVIVSTLSAVRLLPFRVVFACGLGEGRFPSPEPEDPLDLRWARRREGDVTARERDRYAFFELLLQTGDRLSLSYVSRDPITGDTLAPSSVVEELMHGLSRAYGKEPRTLAQSHPLRRWDPRYFPDLFPNVDFDPLRFDPPRLPEARVEARSLALRLDMEARTAPLDGVATARVSRQHILARAKREPGWAALAHHLGLALLPEGRAAIDPRISVPMYAIAKFLEFPLQGWAKFRLGLDEPDDDDSIAREDEPFETRLRDETVFLRSVLLEAKNGDRAIVQAYDDAVHHRELRGLGPSGVFARGERAEHLETLETWRGEVSANDIGVGTLVVHRFGRAGEHARADRVHDALLLEVDVVDRAGVARIVRVDVGGRTLPMGAGTRVSVTLNQRAEQKDDWARAGRERAALRAFVDHAVLAASGVSGDQPRASLSVVATADGPVTERIAFGALSQNQAIVWLRDIVRELLSGPHAYFLPCEAVLVHQRLDPRGPVTPYLEIAREKLRDTDGAPALRSAYGPAPRLVDYPAPDEETARAMIARRYGRIFERWEVSS